MIVKRTVMPFRHYGDMVDSGREVFLEFASGRKFMIQSEYGKRTRVFEFVGDGLGLLLHEFAASAD